eukprot:403259_1
MSAPKKRTVKVGVVQTRTDLSVETQKNLSTILPFIERAVDEHKTELILLPELAPNQYIWHSSQWNYGETMSGYSVKWLQKHSKRLKIYLGMTFLEVDAQTLDFYNTFVMADDNGNIIAKIRKNTPCSFETWYWCSNSTDKHVFETRKFGKIIIGICFENHFAYVENELISNLQSISMILMPHCVPRADPFAAIGWTKSLCDQCNDTINNISVNYAKKYKIPVLYSNKCGPLNSPIPLLPFMKYGCYDYGNSKIVDANGNIVAEAKDGCSDKVQNELIVGEIEIFGNKINDKLPLNCTEWSSQNYFSSFNRKAILAQGLLGQIYYKCSIMRRIRCSASVDVNNSVIPYVSALTMKVIWVSTLFGVVWAKY